MKPLYTDAPRSQTNPGKLVGLAFRLLLQSSPDMIFVKDINLVYVAASCSFARMVGLQSDDEVVGKTDFDIFDEQLARKYTEDDRSLLRDGINFLNYIEPLPDNNGQKSYSSTSKYLLRDDNGEIIGLYGLARDVTAQYQLEAERESSRLSRQMFDDVLEADVTEDRMLRVEGSDWVHALLPESGMQFTEAVELLTQRFIHPDYQAEFRARYGLAVLMSDYASGVQEFSHLTYVNIRGGYRWVECKTRVYHSRVSDTLRITTFLKDVDDETKSRQCLQKKAVTDALTGLLNRENVLERINLSLRESACDTMKALLFIDLDCFKQVNDRWGHLFGDKVLRGMAERLRQTFGGEDIYGRIGGDEFLVLIHDVPSRAAIEERARRIVDALSFLHFENQEEICVTCSVGVVLYRGDNTPIEMLYEQADRAMYKAKENGRNGVYFFDDL